MKIDVFQITCRRWDRFGRSDNLFSLFSNVKQVSQRQRSQVQSSQDKRKVVVFTIYGHGGHHGHVTRILHIHIVFFFLFHRCFNNLYCICYYCSWSCAVWWPYKFPRTSSILFYFGPLRSVRIITALNSNMNLGTA